MEKLLSHQRASTFDLILHFVAHATYELQHAFLLKYISPNMSMQISLFILFHTVKKETIAVELAEVNWLFGPYMYIPVIYKHIPNTLIL